MERVLVWDWPVRVFHGLLVVGFASAAGIALGLGDDSTSFWLHAVIGLGMAMAVLLRVVWGLMGSRHARFTSWLPGPRAVVRYFLRVLSGRGERHMGHNPGSAGAIVLIMLLTLGLAGSGVAMARGVHGVKDAHEFMAWALVAVVGLHIAGVLLHMVMHRENIVASMLHGRKRAETDAERGQGIGASHRTLGALMGIITLAWTGALWWSYNPATGVTKVPIVGTDLKIGDATEGEPEPADGD